MSRAAGVGFTLQPEERYLELLGALLREEPDYYEIAPETTWRPAASGAFVPNGYQERFAALAAETGRPLVAHGVGFSLGSARRDPARDARWLAAIAADHRRFQFRWYSDHLGATVLDGRELALPLPLPMSEEAAEAVRAGLSALRSVVPDIGFENSVFYFHLGNPLDEPRWIARCLAGTRAHLVLDLHNVHTTACNARIDSREYLARLPLERVIEIHLSGGSASDARWLASRRVLRLDSHDDAVPEEVWQLLDEALPRCSNLRGVTLERMEGTVHDESDAAELREELRRARRALEAARGS